MKSSKMENLIKGTQIEIISTNFKDNHVMKDLIAFYKTELKDCIYHLPYLLECSLIKSNKDGSYSYSIVLSLKGKTILKFKRPITYKEGIAYFKDLKHSIGLIMSKTDSFVRGIADIDDSIDFIRYSEKRSSPELINLYKKISKTVGESSLFMGGFVSQLIADDKLFVYCLGNKIFSVLERDNKYYKFSKVYFISDDSEYSVDLLVESLLYLDAE